MIRDTLEMVPVAVVLAVVLSFGVRPSHRQAASLSSNIADLSQGQTTALGRSTSRVTGPVTPHGSDGKDSSTPGARTSPAMVQVETQANSSVPIIFMPRRSQDPEVPFFTSADLPARSGASHTSSGMAWRALPRSTPSTSTARAQYGSAVYQEPTSADRSVRGHRKTVINQAQLEELVRIPGIGRSRAEMIISQRPAEGYSGWEQIDALPGFGPGTIGALMQHADLNGFPAGEDRRNP